MKETQAPLGNIEKVLCNCASAAWDRRAVLGSGVAAGLLPLVPADAEPSEAYRKRFPHFVAAGISYQSVKVEDTFWAPRQKVVADVSVAWASGYFDPAGGLRRFKAQPATYRSQLHRGDLEAIKFVEAMAAVVGVTPDPAIEGLTDIWAQQLMSAQDPDGYWHFGWPIADDLSWRWKPVWWSHEDYAIGHYLESGIGLKEATGRGALYDSAVRAVDDLVKAVATHPNYLPGHEEVEQALMRLYGLTGDVRYLRVCGVLIGRRGHPVDRVSFGSFSQDQIPVAEQRTIEGHAVRAAFLFNGVTEYVGATGDEDYRATVEAVWRDFVDHKMYITGAGGRQSAGNEGYSPVSDELPPGDCYGESCSVFGNFQWAHNMFALTGSARHLDVAERMLYNAFYASLSLQGDRYFYENPIQSDTPTMRFAWHAVPCCPPNIIKLFSKIGGFIYATNTDEVFVKHYIASSVTLSVGQNLKLSQVSDYPWKGDIKLLVKLDGASTFALNLRIPRWADQYSIRVNGEALAGVVSEGWVRLHRKWQDGDQVDLHLPMGIRRSKAADRFLDYRGLVALERGPIVYCVEEADLGPKLFAMTLPEHEMVQEEFRPDLLGGVMTLRAKLSQMFLDGEPPVLTDAVFIPYGVWNNRTPGQMRVWLPIHKPTLEEAVARLPDSPTGTK